MPPTSPRPPSSPGHSWVPQGSSCMGGPSQKSPWPWGVGLEQARLRLRTPAPQLRLQPLQGLQGLQPPGPAARGLLSTRHGPPPRTPAPRGATHGHRAAGGRGAPGAAARSRVPRGAGRRSGSGAASPARRRPSTRSRGSRGSRGAGAHPLPRVGGISVGPRRFGGSGAARSSPRGRRPQFGAHSSFLGQIPPSPPVWGTSPHFGHTPPFRGTPLQVPPASGASRVRSPKGHQGRVGAVPAATPRRGVAQQGLAGVLPSPQATREQLVTRPAMQELGTEGEGLWGAAAAGTPPGMGTDQFWQPRGTVSPGR